MQAKHHAIVERRLVDRVVQIPTPCIRTYFTFNDIHGLKLSTLASLLCEVITGFARHNLRAYEGFLRADFGIVDIASGMRHIKAGDADCAWNIEDLDLHGLAHRFVTDPYVHIECGSRLMFFTIVHPEHALPYVVTGPVE